ncbi:hypothetical protein TTRE_0000196801 [Trichuris trichiura]|uniref:Uncharacterized protein n=1 Tax=Trichuris trichiura TaxID=36087 RepID=A0A077Z1Z7_TRITR|nr:hypothetical protein TTRE_0000196801 [Trichuris trichiura]
MTYGWPSPAPVTCCFLLVLFESFGSNKASKKSNGIPETDALLSTFDTACLTNAESLQNKSSWIRIAVEKKTQWSSMATVASPNGQIAQGLQQLVVEAVNRRILSWYNLLAKHAPAQSVAFANGHIHVQIMNISTLENPLTLQVDFVALLDCQIMDAAALVADINRLSIEEASSLLAEKFIKAEKFLSIDKGFPAGTIVSITIAAIFGPILLGWCILFVYYNTCAGMTWDGVFEKPSSEEIETPMSSLPDLPKVQNITGSSQVDSQNSKSEAK